MKSDDLEYDLDSNEEYESSLINSKIFSNERISLLVAIVFDMRTLSYSIKYNLVTLDDYGYFSEEVYADLQYNKTSINWEDDRSDIIQKIKDIII